MKKCLLNPQSVTFEVQFFQRLEDQVNQTQSVKTKTICTFEDI
jgi:hypothetical protein